MLIDESVGKAITVRQFNSGCTTSRTNSLHSLASAGSCIKLFAGFRNESNAYKLRGDEICELGIDEDF